MAPPTSPVFMIPNVFVTPPDEGSAPYLCFDSVESTREVLSNPPNPISIHTALSIHDQATTPPPVFHRNSLHQEDLVMPRKSHRKPAPREPENDSDVVEVIKVRKRVDSPPPLAFSVAGTEETKAQGKSSTLKSRASKAFMSLKTIGKSSGTSTTHVADVFVAPEEARATSPTPMSRSTSKRLRRPKSMIIGDTTDATQPVTLGRRASQLARRSSINLSSLFNNPKDAKVPPPDESFTVFPAADESIGPAMGAPLNRCQSHQPPSEPAPPAPPLAPRSAPRKFSMNGLQKFFSFSTLPSTKSTPAPVPPPASESRTATPISHLRRSTESTRSDETETESEECILPSDLSSPPPSSTTSSTSSSLSSSGKQGVALSIQVPPPLEMTSSSRSDGEDDSAPITPTDERPRPSFSSHASRRKSFASEPRVSHDFEEDVDQGLEMRLDSLHFDELSFDLERF